MASSSYTLSLALQIPRCASSARLGLCASTRPWLSLQTTSKGLRSVAATSSQHEEAGNGDNGGIAKTTSALHLVAGDDVDDDAVDELIRAEERVRGGAPRSPNGRPGAPREGSGGSGGKVHAAPRTLLRLPKEGAGGQGGSIH